MKKILFIFPAFLLVIVLSGCGNTDTDMTSEVSPQGNGQGQQQKMQNQDQNQPAESLTEVPQQEITVEEIQTADSSDAILEEADALMEELNSLDY